MRGRTGQKFILRIVGGPSLFHEKRLKKWTFGPISRFYTKKTPAFLFRKSKFQRNFSFMDVICFWLVRKDWIPIKETNFRVGLFTTISGKFFADYINIFYKTEVQTIICLMCLNLNWIKSYYIKHFFFHFRGFFQFWKKKWKFVIHKLPFYDHFWSLFCQVVHVRLG